MGAFLVSASSVQTAYDAFKLALSIISSVKIPAKNVANPAGVRDCAWECMPRPHRVVGS